MIELVSQLYTFPIDNVPDVKNLFDTITQERKVEFLLRKYDRSKLKTEWIQSSTTDGKNIYTVITLVVMTE